MEEYTISELVEYLFDRYSIERDFKESSIDPYDDSGDGPYVAWIKRELNKVTIGKKTLFQASKGEGVCRIKIEDFNTYCLIDWYKYLRMKKKKHQEKFRYDEERLINDIDNSKRAQIEEMRITLNDSFQNDENNDEVLLGGLFKNRDPYAITPEEVNKQALEMMIEALFLEVFEPIDKEALEKDMYLAKAYQNGFGSDYNLENKTAQEHLDNWRNIYITKRKK